VTAYIAIYRVQAVAYRSLEHPQRPYKVWSMDVSKQVVSSAAAHVCGMGIRLLNAPVVMPSIRVGAIHAGMIIAVLASRAQAHEVSSCAWCAIYLILFLQHSCSLEHVA